MLTVSRVEQHMINKGHPLFDLIDDYSFLSKNLYNHANYHIRQVFIAASRLSKDEEITERLQTFLNDINEKVDGYNKVKEENFKKAQSKAQSEGRQFIKVFKPLDYFGENHKYLGYDFLQFIMSDSDDYRAMMAQAAQQTLMLLDKAWISFFASIKDWKINPDKYEGKPNLPKYKHKKNGRFNIVFTNQNCKIQGNYIVFPTCFNQFKLRTTVTGNLQQVRIKPLGSRYLLEVVYKKEVEDLSEADSDKIIGIDLGLNNFATIANNIGLKPIIINGRILKSINQLYNKKLSFLKKILKKETNRDWSINQDKLTTKRNNQIKDYIHKASAYIIDYCKKWKIDTIVVGNNKHLKTGIDHGDKNNQNFVSIPFLMFIEQLQYKAEENSIKCFVTEESYTSKSSFLDNDFLPVFDEKFEGIHEFSGSRIKRGLYRSSNGTLVNADVNGAFNIIKKVFPDISADGIAGVGLNPVKIRLNKEDINFVV